MSLLHLFNPTVVPLGLDPRGLHFISAPPVQSPRVKPEGDDLWSVMVWGINL